MVSLLYDGYPALCKDYSKNFLLHFLCITVKYTNFGEEERTWYKMYMQ
jgi:hypothetical protein